MPCGIPSICAARAFSVLHQSIHGLHRVSSLTPHDAQRQQRHTDYQCVNCRCRHYSFHSPLMIALASSLLAPIAVEIIATACPSVIVPADNCPIICIRLCVWAPLSDLPMVSSADSTASAPVAISSGSPPHWILVPFQSAPNPQQPCVSSFHRIGRCLQGWS